MGLIYLELLFLNWRLKSIGGVNCDCDCDYNVKITDCLVVAVKTC